VEQTQIQIQSFDELIEFLKANELTPEETIYIVRHSLKCFIIGHATKDEIIEALITHWNKWKHVKEKPLFISLVDIGNRQKK
jgi:hypothetical protein